MINRHRIKNLIFIGGAVSLAVILLDGQVQATSYQYAPSPVNLGSLSHDYYYAWGIQWTGPSLSGPQAETIDSVSFTIQKINNWTYEPDDVLHVWLLDSLPNNINWAQKNWSGISIGLDNNKTSDDAFANSGGTFLMNYVDENEKQSQDVKISIPVDILTQYISNDGYFGIALDPDCHYYNTGMSLDFILSPNRLTIIPEPATVAGIFCGLSALAGYWRKRKQT